MLLNGKFNAGTMRLVRILGLIHVIFRVIMTSNNIFTRIIRMLDATDTRILQLVQANAMLTAQDLGAALNLSASQAARRRQRLEAEGFVTGYAARIDPARVGLTVQAFIQVQFARHDPELARSFATLIATLPEVISAWTLTGEADYLLRVWCADLPGLNRLIHERLLPHPAVARVQSQIVMDQLKSDAPLPIRA
jgi:DNA-binding Lrp family transcriptional regulator